MYRKLENSIADNLSLKPEDIYNHGLTIAEVVIASPTAINSIDIFEAFAGALAEHEVDDVLNLPTFTLEDKIDRVMGEINTQIESYEAIK